MVNYLLNPEKWTRQTVNTERSQMNNSKCTFENDIRYMILDTAVGNVAAKVAWVWL